MERFDEHYWAVILGGSSGFGLATAHELARHGMNLCIVHRDRRAALPEIERELGSLRDYGIRLLSFNCDATNAEQRHIVARELEQAMKPDGCVRLLLHSIAFGNLKPVAPASAGGQKRTLRAQALDRLALALNIDSKTLSVTLERLFADGCDALHSLVNGHDHGGDLLTEEDFAHTIHAMGTSLIGWVHALHQRGLFAADARVLGMTSEGNTIAWHGYAAVSAAKAVLEAAVRSLAVEFAPFGLRVNVLQAGITETPALKQIPGYRHLVASARLRNPYQRLTTPADVARVIYLLSRDEAAWINGSVIRVDGGEHIAGL